MSDSDAPKRRLARRRRANVAGGRRHSHRVLVTPEEEAQLVQRAERERVSGPRLLIEAALAGAGETPTQRRQARSALFGMRRSLAGMVINVNQLPKQGNVTGEFPREAEQVL